MIANEIVPFNPALVVLCVVFLLVMGVLAYRSKFWRGDGS